MTSHRTAGQLELQALGRRQVVATFNGGRITSDGGLLLLHEVLQRTGLLRRFAARFTDHRDPARVEHTVHELLSQRVLGLACGYEDLNDHATLRDDPLLAAVVGKKKPLGDGRKTQADRGHPLASPSTLNRLELTPADANTESRYRKIVYDEVAIGDFFVASYLGGHRRAPLQVVLDLDATDDPVHGRQEGRFFHGYYRHYCYLPLYIFAGDELLCAKLRPSNIDSSAGALAEVERIVRQIRRRWPKTRVILRADSGFARDALMTWCEENAVDYVFGLARNTRLQEMVEKTMARVCVKCEHLGEAVREFRELRYRTLKTWTRRRRVVAKVECLPGKQNPRFVVTSLASCELDARSLYEDTYCARGDMENRIKEQQLWLFADRTSAHTMRANQLRLWLSSVAYVLLNMLKRFGLRGTVFAKAQVGTIRNKLIKLGGVVTVSVRRIVVALSECAPVRDLYPLILLRLREQLRAVE